MLTSYAGVAITHDEIGNPLNDGTWTYTWENGRQLASMTDGTVTWNYEYNADGLRTNRNNGNTSYEYTYSGSQLVQMVVNTNSGSETTSRDVLYFAGSTVTYNDTVYYYIKNLQGDITHIADSSGTVVVSYIYDAWGNILSISGTMADTLGALNPFRYRGYVYDSETSLYYLQSRYYDPEMGRFINADGYTSTGQGLLDNNMFAYCNNNPVMCIDYCGLAPEWWQWAISGAMVVGGVFLIATGIGGPAGGALICAGTNSIIGSYTSEAAGGSSTAGWAGGMITGGISGLGAGVAGNLMASATNMTGISCIGTVVVSGAIAYGSGALGAAVGTSVSAAIDNKRLSRKKVIETAMLGGTVNMVAGIASGMGTAITDMPLISETSKVLANSLTAGWSIIAEAVCDAISTIAGLLG